MALEIGRKHLLILTYVREFIAARAAKRRGVETNLHLKWEKKLPLNYFAVFPEVRTGEKRGPPKYFCWRTLFSFFSLSLSPHVGAVGETERIER